MLYALAACRHSCAISTPRPLVVVIALSMLMPILCPPARYAASRSSSISGFIFHFHFHPISDSSASHRPPQVFDYYHLSSSTAYKSCPCPLGMSSLCLSSSCSLFAPALGSISQSPGSSAPAMTDTHYALMLGALSCGHASPFPSVSSPSPSIVLS